MIGHGVACYGAADRYLGMLAATLGEWRARGAPLRGARWRSTGGWAPQTWLAHTAYEYGRMLLRARRRAAATRARGAARRGGRARRADRHARAARPDPRRSERRDAAAGAPGRPVLPRGADPRARRRGPQQPRDRRSLFISEHTAANHIRSILRKTRCANRTEAASYAHRHGLVEA